MIYLDYAATTPMSEEAIDAYSQAANRFYANSNSLHDDGSNASGALNSSRRLLASILGVQDTGLHFTGSGSEAVFLALYGLAMASKSKGSHIITSQAEHSCVRNACRWLERHHGFEVSEITALKNGKVDLDQLQESIRPDTVLVSIQHVNSETGAINPLKKIGELLSGHQAKFHSDCVQSFCKLTIDPANWNLDSVSVSAHKIHGPKGIGASYIHPRVRWEPFMPESSQERGFRAGTVDVPAVVAFASAARKISSEQERRYEKVKTLKTSFIDKLRELAGDAVHLEGDPGSDSPYICGLRVHGMEGQFAMLQCSQNGIAISTGSACQINEQKPSATMLAMGYDEEEAKQFVRFSFDASVTQHQVLKAAGILAGLLNTHLERVNA